MHRRQLLVGSLAASALACSKAPRVPSGGGSALRKIREEYETLMAEHGLHEWARYAGQSTPGADEAAFVAELRRKEEDVVRRAARAAEADPSVEPRERALWTRAAKGLEVLGDAETARLSDALEKVQNDFVFEIAGKRVTRADLRKLATGPDAEARRAQRRASSALHREAAPIAKALLRRRRDLGKGVGGFRAALLALRGLEERSLDALFDGLAGSTRAAYQAALRDGKDRASLPAAKVWDLDFVAKNLGQIPDDAFPAAGAIPLVRAVFGAIGVDLDKPKVRIDVRDFAFGGQTISIRVPTDVRTVVTPTLGARFYATFLHELGHAFASTRNREENALFRGYEWIPGLTEPGYDEGVAEIFGRALDEPDALARFVPSLSAADQKAHLASRMRAELFGLRQRFVGGVFEREALRDPDGDLDALSRRVEADLLGVEVPDDTEPVWATSPFLATYPVYVQSYTLAALLSAQVRAALRRTLAGTWLTPDGGKLLETFVADGMRTTADEKLQKLTGAPLSADAYLRWLAGEERSLPSRG